MGRLIAFTLVLIALAVLGMNLMARTELNPEDCLLRVRRAQPGRFAAVVASDKDELEIEYDDGVRLSVPRGPRRIVSTLPGITESVVFLGGFERLSAVSPHCDTPAEVSSLRTVAVQPLDVEALLDVDPDLVILDRRLHRPSIDKVRKRVGGVLLLDTSRSLLDLRTSMDLLARVLDTAAAGERSRNWGRELQGLEVGLEERWRRPPPRVLAVAQWDPLYVMGPGSLLDDLVRACGCINVACDLRAGASGRFPEELVLARRPDWLLLPPDDMPDELRERWQHVPAVVRDAWLDGSTDELVRGGPRILQGLRTLSEAIMGDRPR